MRNATEGSDATDADGSNDEYVILTEAPSPREFVDLREAAGMGPRSIESAERGLPNSLFAVTVVHETDGTVGMGRVVGDDGAVYQISDMAVHPDHQGRGLGTRIMERLMAYVEETAPPSAYVNLIADVDGFYEKFGFEEVRPASKGMFRRIE
jgi:GNAT superfamily N-acetyltransferase